MGFLMLLARKISLQRRHNNIQYQLTTINNQLEDYTSYASVLSQDSVSMSDIASLPSSLFMQGVSELTNAHYQALQLSNSQMSQAASSGLFNSSQNQYLQNIAQQKMYENARKQIQKQLAAQLNEKEKALETKKTTLETLDAEIQQELQSINEPMKNGIQSSISSYGLT